MLLSLLLACNPAQQPATDTDPTWLYPACQVEGWSGVPEMIWRTRSLDGLSFAMGHDTLMLVSDAGVRHYTPPLGVTEEALLWDGRLWASDWKRGLLVCQTDGWVEVQGPALGHEPSDSAQPLVLGGALAMLVSIQPSPDCSPNSECGVAHRLDVYDGQGWTETRLDGERGSGPAKWLVHDSQLLFNYGHERWQLLDGQDLVDADAAYPEVFWSMPDQDWLVGYDTPDAWTHGPLGEQQSLPELPADYTYLRVEITAPGEYLASDLSHLWSFQDGAWTELPLLSESWVQSASAGQGGVLAVQPLQWISQDDAVQVPL